MKSILRKTVYKICAANLRQKSEYSTINCINNQKCDWKLQTARLLAEYIKDTMNGRWLYINKIRCIDNYGKQKKKTTTKAVFSLMLSNNVRLLHLVDDGLESLGVVQSEVGKDLAVDFDARLGELVHELAVVHAILADGSVSFLLIFSSSASLLSRTFLLRQITHFVNYMRSNCFTTFSSARSTRAV